MRLTESLLLFLSRKPESNDYRTAGVERTSDNALTTLCRDFPDFMSSIVGKEILDFGCGMGLQVITMARNGAKYVLGIDINKNALKKGQDLAREFGVTQQVEFTDKLEDRFKNRFDIVISQNSMEHFEDPVKILDEMKSALNQDGKILITFAPPWFAPYGSHMHFFCKVPWINILFSERTVMKVRSNFRSDGATKYEEVESGLNKMTVTKFERIVANAKLTFEIIAVLRGSIPLANCL
jgi:SAM-dependent methyltransferase